MKTIKRILSLLLSLFLVMTLLPMGSVSVKAEGETTYVAQIGEAQYESFDEAVAAAQAGDTIVLLDDITFGTDRSVPVWGNAGEQPFNIDLNGFTFQTDSEVSIDAGNNGYKASAFCFAFDNEANITVSGGEIKTAFGAGVYISGENVSLTLEDVDIAQNYPQNVQTTNEYSSAVRITYEASVEINGGTYGGKNSIAVSNTGGTAVINDGTFYNDIFFSNYTSKSYYDNSRDAVKSITINGGTFYGNFVNPDKGTLVIKGGKFASDPSAYVAEGYKVVAIEEEGLYYQVGIIEYNPSESTGELTDGVITYTMSTDVVDTKDSENTLETNTNLTISVTGTTTETFNEGEASVAIISLENIATKETLDTIVSTVLKTAGNSITDSTETADVVIRLVKSAADTTTSGKVIYEVHPEAIVKVNDEEVGSVELENNQLAGTFSFKLYVGDIAQDGDYVKVTHIHSNDASEVMGSFLVENGYIEITGVTSFSNFELEVVDIEEEPHATFGFTIALEDSINIVYNVKDLVGDLEDFEIVYTDPTTGQEVSVQPTSRSVNKYTIAKCAARQMADEFSIKVYYQESQINQTDTLSIKDYCGIIINGDYNDYLKDLCKATLDYGKYAQIEFDYNLDNLANGGTDYFVNEEIDVPAYDGEILNKFTGAYVSFNLVTKSQTIFHIYVTSEEASGYGISVNEQLAGPKVARMIRSDKVDVTIPGIKARDLGEKVEVAVDLAGNSNQMIIRLSPVDYMGYAVNTVESQVEINRAYYNYYVKAYDYFNNK